MPSNEKQGQRAAGIVLALVLCGSPAGASSITEALEGEWSGSGRLVLANGESERIRCHGESRAVSENAVEQEFECASTAKEFDFATSLNFSGKQVSGDWWAPDRSGTLTGRASATSLELSLSSARGDGNLSATISGCRQSLRVTGWSDELKSLSVDLRKSC